MLRSSGYIDEKEAQGQKKKRQRKRLD